MPVQDQVRQHFNRKAGAWGRKYDASGPLAHRIGRFEARLRAMVSPPADVLDLGCGTGNLAAHLAGCGYRVSACDISEEMLAQARQAFPEAKVIWSNLPAGPGPLPCASNSLDALVSSSVFEYLDDPAATLRECARVLRPGGALLISVPNPGHPGRRLEGLARPVATRLRKLPLPWPGRLGSFMSYLALSRNRFPLARWEAIARQAGFERHPTVDDASGTLALLTFRRRAPAAPERSPSGSGAHAR